MTNSPSALYLDVSDVFSQPFKTCPAIVGAASTVLGKHIGRNNCIIFFSSETVDECYLKYIDSSHEIYLSFPHKWSSHMCMYNRTCHRIFKYSVRNGAKPHRIYPLDCSEAWCSSSPGTLTLKMVRNLRAINYSELTQHSPHSIRDSSV